MLEEIVVVLDALIQECNHWKVIYLLTCPLTYKGFEQTEVIKREGILSGPVVAQQSLVHRTGINDEDINAITRCQTLPSSQRRFIIVPPV